MEREMRGKRIRAQESRAILDPTFRVYGRNASDERRKEEKRELISRCDSANYDCKSRKGG